jgi:hypothetical protein
MTSGTSLTFSSLPLHDAVLKELTVDWASRTCVAEVSAFVDGLKSPAQERRIVWRRIEEVVVPRRAPWGDSVHINSAREEDGQFVIEMQSGDVIRVAAAGVEFS